MVTHQRFVDNMRPLFWTVFVILCTFSHEHKPTFPEKKPFQMMRLYLLTIGRLNYFFVVYAISYRKQRLNIRLSLKRSLLSWWQNLHQFSFRSSWRPRITWQDVYRANVFRLHDYALSSRTRGRNRTGRAMSRNFPDRRRKENKSANKSCGTLDGHAPPPKRVGPRGTARSLQRVNHIATQPRPLTYSTWRLVQSTRPGDDVLVDCPRAKS